MTNDYIRRQDMFNAVEKLDIIPSVDGMGIPTDTEDFRVQFLGTVLKVEPADVVPTESQEIGYGQCANAMLKMWMDNVVTDREYNRIMDRLNKLYLSRGEREE